VSAQYENKVTTTATRQQAKVPVNRMPQTVANFDSQLPSFALKMDVPTTRAA
jgi:hypothetical protein